MKKLTPPWLFCGTASTCPDIRYATSFETPDEALVLATARKTVLVVSDMEYGRALDQARGCEVHCPATLKLAYPDSASPAAWALALLRKRQIIGVYVPKMFPLGIAKALEKDGIGVDVGSGNPFERKRMVKSPEEIACIAKTQKAARAAMKAVGDAIKQARPGKGGLLMLDGKELTSERARKIVRGEILARNCIDEGTIIAGGTQAANPHETGHGPLKTGEWIVCDIFPRNLDTGYWGDMTRTFMNGTPDPERKRMYNAVLKAQKLALSIIRAGIEGSAVHKATSESMVDANFETYTGDDGMGRGFIHSTGHGVGLEIHEMPRLSPSGGKLEAGMVVSVEPGLYYPELGGVRIEDLVVVEEDGVRIL